MFYQVAKEMKIYLIYPFEDGSHLAIVKWNPCLTK